jgi:hypothetical protein
MKSYHHFMLMLMLMHSFIIALHNLKLSYCVLLIKPSLYVYENKGKILQITKLV